MARSGRAKDAVDFIDEHPDDDVVVPADGSPYVREGVGATGMSDRLRELIDNGLHFAGQIQQHHPHLSQWMADMRAYLDEQV